MMATAKPKRDKRPALPESYFQLVREFPLVAIRDEGHLDDADAMIRRLLEQELDAGQESYLEALSSLVEQYEDEHHAIPDAPPADVLRSLMESHGLSQSALSRETKIQQSTISDVLLGKRELTPRQMVTLATRFGLPAAVFLPLPD